jgi:ectoine hydroxylase-related dioxygenase (phytanoyl-CoA dioxygenase family)
MEADTARAPISRSQYEADGYLLDLPVLSAAEVARYRAVYDQLEREHTGPGRITNRHFDVPELWQLATHPRVLALMTQLIGPNLILLSSGFFAKQPDNATAFVDWHQDTAYWALDPPIAHTVWIAIDAATVENGCMQVVPGSHRNGLLAHGTAERPGNLLGHNQAISPHHFDAGSAIDCVLAPGRASVHHGLLVHGSNPNTSPHRRCGATFRYTTPDVRPVMDGPTPFRERPVLVAGEDHFGHLPLVSSPAGGRLA